MPGVRRSSHPAHRSASHLSVVRRPPRPVEIPKPPPPVHQRKAALRMVLLAGAISAFILYGRPKVQEVEVDPGLATPPLTPLELSGPPPLSPLSTPEVTWAQATPALQDCLQGWWMQEPQRARVDLDLSVSATTTLRVDPPPPAATQACLQSWLDTHPFPAQPWDHHATLDLAPGVPSP